MPLTYTQYQYVWPRLTPDQQEDVKRKCEWEQMGRWAVLNEWTHIVPAALLLELVDKGIE